jgi:hypothetical protein|eukprot:COSAG01_NODE_613_length_14831_cov_8.108675_12_plen_50_part_00
MHAKIQGGHFYGQFWQTDASAAFSADADASPPRASRKAAQQLGRGGDFC